MNDSLWLLITYLGVSLLGIHLTCPMSCLMLWYLRFAFFLERERVERKRELRIFTESMVRPVCLCFVFHSYSIACIIITTAGSTPCCKSSVSEEYGVIMMIRP